MASPAQPPTSQTTLRSLDSLKPSINASDDSRLIQAIATNDTFPASPADITVGELSAQVAPGGQFNLLGVEAAPVGFSVTALANSSQSSSGWFFTHIVNDPDNHPLRATLGHQVFHA